MERGRCILFLLVALTQLRLHQTDSQSFLFDYPSANLSTKPISWTIQRDKTINFTDGSAVNPILLRSNPSNTLSFACGFYCDRSNTSRGCSAFLFAVFIVFVNSGGNIVYPAAAFPQVVWSANRDKPVNENAALELTADGLVLRDGGSVVWSASSSGKSVIRMTLELTGNLRLLDSSGTAVWQSFDHPADVLLSGQVLSGNRMLLANVSASNWTRDGTLYLSATGAYANATPPQRYYSFNGNIDIQGKPCFVRVSSDSVVFVANSTPNGRSEQDDPLPSTTQFLRFDYDGHLRLREWVNIPVGWMTTADVFNKYDLGDCAYPTVCGSYGICSDGRDKCRCPAAADDRSSAVYFRPFTDPNLGFFCSETTPVTCGTPDLHRLLPLQDVSYFNIFVDRNIRVSDEATIQECQDACLNNCSCKAAFFHRSIYASDSDPNGTCYFQIKLFSLMANQLLRSHINSTAFIKVQDPPPPMTPPERFTPTLNSTNAPVPVKLITGAAVGSAVVLVIIVIITTWLKRKKKGLIQDEDNEAEFDHFPGMPTRFSYQQLITATENFNLILGKGGFATVFKGTLPDGVEVAVKRLERVQQITKEFLAEVKVIGRVSHINLLRLIGFCADKSHRMLLYEYMGNGSLDGWIFNETDEGRRLSWDVRKKIIYQLAKGLVYLHDECIPKILHLDIKPQNILLDDDFNAKISDFGLSKRIDRNQSCVMTTMVGLRGTPGYMAPELLTFKITDKLDVYSFGVVLVEIVCQRRNLDNAQSEYAVHLLDILCRMATDGQLKDFTSRYCHDMQNQEKEAMEMLQLAIWCLQSDKDRRPSMSEVIKVLERTMEVPDVEFNFLSPVNRLEYCRETSATAPLMASVLSGPR